MIELNCINCGGIVTFPGSKYCGTCFDRLRDLNSMLLEDLETAPGPDLVERITPWVIVFFVGLALGYAWAWNALEGL